MRGRLEVTESLLPQMSSLVLVLPMTDAIMDI